MKSRFHSITMNRFLNNGLTSTSNALSHRSVPLVRQTSNRRNISTAANRFTACASCYGTIGSSQSNARFSSTPIRMFSSQSNDTLQKSSQDTSSVASYPNPAQMNRIPSNANSTQSESDNLLSLKAFLRKQGFSDWNDFLAYRRRRHLLSRLFAFPFGLIPIPVFYSLLSSPMIDPTRPLLGMDPMVALGLGFLGSLFAAGAVGGGVPGVLLRLFNGKTAAQYDVWQKNFFARIVKNRANIAAANPAKPVMSLDLYGEQVFCVPDYRRWLRKHREFARQKQYNLTEQKKQ